MGQQSVSSSINGNSKGFGSSNPSTSGQAQYGSPNPSFGKGGADNSMRTQMGLANGQVNTSSTTPPAASAIDGAPSGKGGSSPVQQAPTAPTQPQAPMSNNLADYGPGSPFYNLAKGTDPNGMQNYKGISNAQHPDGNYSDTNDAIARKQAMMTTSQQGFQNSAGSPAPNLGFAANRPSSGKGGGK